MMQYTKDYMAVKHISELDSHHAGLIGVARESSASVLGPHEIFGGDKKKLAAK